MFKDMNSLTWLQYPLLSHWIKPLVMICNLIIWDDIFKFPSIIMSVRRTWRCAHALWAIYLTGCKQMPLKGHATTTFENVSQKNWKVFWNIFHFCHRWIWCDEKIKEYLTFYAYFTRMQKFFHFRRWEFFQKRALFFRKKKLVLFQSFL